MGSIYIDSSTRMNVHLRILITARFTTGYGSVTTSVHVISEVMVERFRLEKLTRGGHYAPWKAQVKAMLTEVDLEEFLSRKATADDEQER
jgi:hypothetical protein